MSKIAWIEELVAWLRERLGGGFAVTDHGQADTFA
jgi:hypothetical protein